MDNPKLLKQFEKIGISNKLAIVYLQLLRSGGDYPANITKITGFNRSTVYKTLADLLSKNLVTEIDQNKKLYYQAQRPEKLLLKIKTKVKEAQDQYDNVERLIPLLLDMYYGDRTV